MTTKQQKTINNVLDRIDIINGVKIIHGNVDLSYLGLTELPDLSDVGINGNFHCNSNNLVSLKGSPNAINGDFVCSNNQLTSLEYCPSINRSLYCGNNQLASLKGGPKIINGNFDCRCNKLTSLEYCPTMVGGHFYCSVNQLTSLEYAPEEINGSFFANINPWPKIINKQLKTSLCLNAKEYCNLINKFKGTKANLSHLKDNPVHITPIEIDI